MMKNKREDIIRADSKEQILVFIKNKSLDFEKIKLLMDKDLVTKDRSILVEVLKLPNMKPALANKYFKFLFPMDIVKILKSGSTNVFVKRAAMQNLSLRYKKLQSGERKVILKLVPPKFLRLVKEENSVVLSEVLKNSRLTEKELIIIIREQKPGPVFVKKVYSNSKWRNREKILFLLLNTSYLPRNIIENSIKKLSRKHLLELLRKPFIHSDIKKKIKELVFREKFS